MSRSSESPGHDALLRGLDLSNNVCEYEVNRLTNEKVIRANCLRRLPMPRISPIYKLIFFSKNPDKS